MGTGALYRETTRHLSYTYHSSHTDTASVLKLLGKKPNNVHATRSLGHQLGKFNVINLYTPQMAVTRLSLFIAMQENELFVHRHSFFFIHPKWRFNSSFTDTLSHTKTPT